MSHRWEETGAEEREREGWREEGGRYNYGWRLPGRERGEKRREGKKDEREERESPAHSGKTIQLVSEGAHSTERKRERESRRGK